MASNALNDHLEYLLEDADHLLDAADELPRGVPGRRDRVAAINRSVVVMCVSAWEAYIEAVVVEALTAIRPPAPPLGLWPALNATVRGQLGRFNTPNAENIRLLVSDALGLANLPAFWTWAKCSPVQAVQRLTAVMTLRHQIAHGVNPRPAVTTEHARPVPEFFRRLGRCTDRVVRSHLVTTLAIPTPWPP